MQVSEESIMTAPESLSRQQVWKMFDRIAHRYDLLNHLLSGNRDVAWRRKMAGMLPERSELDVLDLATGTGDQLITLAKTGKLRSGVGIDLAEKMLALGREKIVAKQLDRLLTLQTGDAGTIPFTDNLFDAVSITFGIRNVLDVPAAFREMYRVLRPNGRALILEFSLPRNGFVRHGYLFYFRHILPRLGGLISGDSHAYRYLNQTVETFPYGEAFCTLMRESGFTNVQATELTFGIATIYSGDKR
ncbi:MAG: bifunctional demethylmenaquinone methyltransferase/2-methoxy-6-polyprenyl-1,4-benzoquinol methylase UbiE [candidate division Zixibacteria bacterium]|nr:bifunctional demethylmenaquinone methyltransferase/2-methoxy-6-polyprenyl-1,4-benzoquinol methylase UbiE [candidate division Zixibacteria bacterium]